ncbi:MAG: hypothetical protein ACR2QM_17395 [Longimicrobiales bacterium]
MGPEPTTQVDQLFDLALKEEERRYARAFPGLAFLSAAFFALPLAIRGLMDVPRSGAIEMTLFYMALGALLFGLITFPGGARDAKRVRTLALLFVAIMNAALVLLTIQAPDPLQIAPPLVALVAVSALSPSVLWLALTTSVQYGHFWLITMRHGWATDLGTAVLVMVSTAIFAMVLLVFRFWKSARLRAKGPQSLVDEPLAEDSEEGLSFLSSA